MPRSWYDYHANALPENPTPEDVEARDYQLSIIADRKPYFMIYVYPDLMKEYKTFIRNVHSKFRSTFRKDFVIWPKDRLDELPEAERDFMRYFYRRLPVSIGDCVGNKICRKIEAIFDGYLKQPADIMFDYTIMQSGCAYTQHQYQQIKALYAEYTDLIRRRVKSRSEDKFDIHEEPDRYDLISMFRQKALTLCSDERMLCDIVLDISYKREGTKQFAWDVCAPVIYRNLLARSGGSIRYPIEDPDGEIMYAGLRFSITEKESVTWSELS